MENILHTCTCFSPLLYIAIWILCATFVILFIHKQGRKKPRTEHLSPPINLSSDTLYDILTFFNRKFLSRQRSVNSRFNETIRLGFANAPYLVFEELEITEYTNKKSICGKGRYIADEAMIDQILAEKFVRFKHADIMSGDRAYIMNVFSTSEPWQTFDLRLSAEFKLTKYNARRLAKCEKVSSISFHGRVTLLPQLLLGNCQKLTVSDDMFKTADSASFPWTEILDFLLRQNEFHEMDRFLEIKTNQPPRATEYFRFIDVMKQRFTTATTPLLFEFLWDTNDAQVFHSDVKVKNIHGQGKLILDQINYYYDNSNSSYIHLYTV